MMKSRTIFAILFLFIPSVLLAQQVVDMDLKVQLAVELLSKDLISKDKVRILNYTELKHDCSIPLSFGIYKYDFAATHMAPGLFILQNEEITLVTDYDYQEIFRKINSLFINKGIKYEDRLIYLSKIFNVLHLRLNSGYEAIPDSLIDLDATLEHESDSTEH